MRVGRASSNHGLNCAANLLMKGSGIGDRVRNIFNSGAKLAQLVDTRVGQLQL